MGYSVQMLMLKLLAVLIVLVVTFVRAYMVAETKTMTPTLGDTVHCLKYVWGFPLLAGIFLYAM